MTRITIATKLRLVSAIAPLVLLIATPILAGAFYLFGLMPALLQENQYAVLRAADGLESALYKMDWGRTQPDGLEIIKGQERRFVGFVDSARSHASTRGQLDKIEQIAQTANPIFDQLRQASPGDDSVEPKLRNLQGLIADLSAANDAPCRLSTPFVFSSFDRCPPAITFIATTPMLASFRLLTNPSMNGSIAKL